ncbi:hypothetical protein HN873_052527, partial [Arachis hypogaea]
SMELPQCHCEFMLFLSLYQKPSLSLSRNLLLSPFFHVWFFIFFANLWLIFSRSALGSISAA